MTDKANVNDVLINLINRAASGVDQAIDFSKAQLPDVIHQLMVWKAVSYSLSILVTAFLLIGCVMAFKRGLALLAEDGSSNRGFALVMSPILPAITCFIILIADIGDALQLWLAPKIWLIEYAASLVK
ncbi:hypothetical protein [Yersinia pekkanenii]|uniref:Uncharacterized protein n=1 Tax=Yersinia pekkanenii TaxID=1288385 RepID=A0A0T9QH25_9GAMM|nr:hypothetical protein [Yersinia pekkanenii]CNI11337.1 Uncharacterised protein [Yersinia pekkanenii]CRY69237.1 Uncharacterised protein [Yersinia pekkanenii]